MKDENLQSSFLATDTDKDWEWFLEPSGNSIDLNAETFKIYESNYMCKLKKKVSKKINFLFRVYLK